MKLAKVSIKNFRSIESIEISIENITRLIGANGSGKSTILKALEIFYMPGTPPVSIDDFHNRNQLTPDQDAEIKLTFNELSADDLTRFGGRTSSNGTLSVTRVLSLNSKTNGKYYGNALKHPNFSGVRAIDPANDKKIAYKSLKAAYPDLPDLKDIKNRAGEIEGALCQWENDHPEQCEESRDDGQFFGFQNVGHGKLSESTALVYIPAVRDASLESSDGKGSAANKLLELVVKSAVEARPDIQTFKQKVEKEFREVMDPTKLTELHELGTQLSGTLQTLYSNTNVLLSWREPAPLILPFPAAEMKLDDEGFMSPVDKTGHGLQRALIITLLQHLALAAKNQSSISHEEGDKKNSGTKGLPGLILAVEEPELYQHPTKQRHVAEVLQKLAKGELAGVAASTQVIYTTHSPLFVSMGKFKEVRIVRRKPPIDVTKQRTCVIHTADLNKVAKILENAWVYRPGTFTADSLLPRLHIIDGAVSEGFFSCVSVLVEGPSDKAALQAVAMHLGYNLEENEIAILPVGGKSTLDKSFVIFNELGIPTFMIWDNDSGEEKRVNHALQRLVGISEDKIQDAFTKVGTNYACFNNELETLLKSEIGDGLWVRLLDQLKVKYGVNKKDAQKNPAIMAELLMLAAKEGASSPTLEKIIKNIMDLVPKNPKKSVASEDKPLSLGMKNPHLMKEVVKGLDSQNLEKSPKTSKTTPELGEAVVKKPTKSSEANN